MRFEAITNWGEGCGVVWPSANDNDFGKKYTKQHFYEPVCHFLVYDM